MKPILKTIVVNSLALFLISQLLSGVKIEDGLITYLFSGVILTLLSFILKPILKLITLPINIITLGAFSFILSIIINCIVLYVLTIFVPQISITAFTFQGAELAGFVIPKFYLGTFWAFVVSAFLLSFIVNMIQWLTKDR